MKMNLGNWKIRFKSHYLVVLFLVAIVTAAVYLTSESGQNLQELGSKQEQQIQERNEDAEQVKKNEEHEQVLKNEDVFARNETDTSSGCNLFSGKWVFDNVSYPLYKGGECTFMLKDYACETYGRRDLKYQNWRWQPHDCDLPRFNGTAFLEKIRGKKLIFVGDSLNKNQWTSMLCIIESSLLPSTSRGVTLEGNLFIFQATEYNATIGFYWSPLLVESNCDNPETHRVRNRIFRIKDIEKHARVWTDADILIFDSFMWWLEPTMTILWGSFGNSEAVYTKVGMRHRRYEMALSTWSDWLELNINRTRTNLFFMSLSPFHFFGETWEHEENCYNTSDPISKDYWGISTDREMMQIAESTIQKLGTRGVKVEYLNITHLSDYRKDAHPTIYRKFNEPPSEEQLAKPTSYSDCVHWCLPGVPDIWNEILYSYIMRL